VKEALVRINLIPPKHNPMTQEPPDGMSLTRSRKLRNKRARLTNGEITLDPSITCKESLTECFRIFTDPERNSTHMAQRYKHRGPTPRCREITIYTNGACMNNGKKNAHCRNGVWFVQDDPRNCAL